MKRFMKTAAISVMSTVLSGACFMLIVQSGLVA